MFSRLTQIWINAVSFTILSASYGRKKLELIAFDLPSILTSLTLVTIGLGHNKKTPIIRGLYLLYIFSHNFVYVFAVSFAFCFRHYESHYLTQIFFGLSTGCFDCFFNNQFKLFI